MKDNLLNLEFKKLKKNKNYIPNIMSSDLLVENNFNLKCII